MLCVTCGAAAYIADSEEHADEADLQPCGCPCGGDTFALAVGIPRRFDQEVCWISIGVRCLIDGILGAPTSQLLIIV